MAGSIVTEIRTPLRRPCMTRISEAEVDSPIKRRGSPNPYKGYPFTFGSGGSGGIDERALTIDSGPRMSPRCVGLRKGNVNSPADHEKPTKSDTVRALQALGMGNNSDIDLIEKKRSTSGSPTPGRQAKVEILKSMPLSGRGADISLVGGRRIQGLEMRDRVSSPREAKQRLDDISIEHQFRRRHHSCPPRGSDCKWKDDFAHASQAEAYAHLLGRPEGVLRATSMREKPRSLSVRPYRKMTSPRGEGCREKSIKENPSLVKDLGHEMVPLSQVMNEPEPELSTRADQQEDAAWDAMLSAISVSPHLFSPVATSPRKSEVPHLSLPATLAAAVAVSTASTGPLSSPSRRTRNNSEPVQRRTPVARRDCTKDFSPPRRPGRMSRQASDATVSTVEPLSPQVLSADATPDWSGGSQLHSTPSRTPSTGSLPSTSRTAKKSSRLLVRDWLHKEQWKARRRAQWVA